MSLLHFQSLEDLPCTFGRYRVVKLLGQGGMGSVYLAEDMQLERSVALKIPHLDGEDAPKLLKRFTREARAAATVMHPNICPLHDVGEIDGVPYLTMGYIDGKPLSAFIGGKPLPERQIAKLVRKLALALAEAHKQGVIHRDLKPSNIMIDKRSEPFIMDFGLARRARHQDVLLTQRGRTVGTPAYMSPEQISADPQAMGPASDIYSLGVILYEMLTGRRPFLGDLMTTVSQVLLEEPQPPSAFRPDIAPALEAICLKAMAKKAADRYGSMAELAGALNDYLRGSVSAAEPPSALLMAVPSFTPDAEPETQEELPSNVSVAELHVPVAQRTTADSVSFRRPRKIRRRQRIPLWFCILGMSGAIAVAAVLAGGLLLIAILKTLDKPAPEKPVVVDKISDYGTIQIEPREPAPDIDLKVDGDSGHHWGEALRLRVGEHEVEGSLEGNVVVREKFTVQAGDNPIHRVSLLKLPSVPPPPPVETANLLLDCNRGRATDIFLMNADGGEAVNLTSKGQYASACPAWSPDGKQIVFSSGVGNFWHLYVMTVEDRAVKQLTTGARIDLTPSWSVDGKLAFSSTSAQVPQPAIYVLSADGSSPPVKLSPANAVDTSPAWSPDGKKIVFLSYRAAANNCRLCVMDADGKNRQEIYSVDIPSWQIPAWSPDGKKIAYVESDGKGAVEVFVIDGDGSNRTQLSHAGGVNKNPAWKPDGKQLAFVHQASSLYLINSDGSGQKEILKDQVQLGRLAWKPRK